MTYHISFPGTEFPPIQLAPHQALSESLTVENSPVLFGCRTGLCGTCLVEIIGDIPPPTTEEQEVLDILAPDNSHARLACQVDLTQDIIIKSDAV